MVTTTDALRFPEPLTAEGLPTPVLMALARTNPVLPVTGPGGGRAWLVAGDAEVREVLGSPDRFTSVTDPDVDQRAGSIALLVGMDPPAHTRLRKLALKAFTAGRVRAMVPEIERLVAELVDDMESAGRPVDLVASLALPLPLCVIGRILGIPDADHDTLLRWSSIFISLTMHTAEEVESALEEVQAYIKALIAARRDDPATDLISDLIRARDGQEALTEGELVGTILLLILAGYETTVKAITRAAIVLGGTDTLHRVQAGELKPEHVVEEILRHQPPIDTGLFRWAKTDTELGGAQIKAGEQLFVSLHLANLDPSSRSEPAEFCPGRDNVRHVTFGYGIHLCLGAALARAEMTAVVKELASRMPNIRSAVAIDEITWTVGAMLNAPVELPVTW